MNFYKHCDKQAQIKETERFQIFVEGWVESSLINNTQLPPKGARLEGRVVESSLINSTQLSPQGPQNLQWNQLYIQ